MTDYGSLADRLDVLVADIDELAFEQLQEAVADGATMRPSSDKRLMQARRAAEKAAVILRRLADEPAP
ncbi:MAG: hypothetical protein AAGA42_12340 [Actinomycetota bacterium]